MWRQIFQPWFSPRGFASDRVLVETPFAGGGCDDSPKAGQGRKRRVSPANIRRMSPFIKGHAIVSVEDKGHAPRTTEQGAEATGPTRKPRADGQRNRERLVEAAKAAFTEVG